MICRNRFVAVAAFATLLSTASLAHAQATRTWVSGVGDDANPCSRTAPCKTFAGAISKTATAGEINTLDPGGFGVVTITKSITLDATAGLGGVLAAGSNGIIINAAGIDRDPPEPRDQRDRDRPERHPDPRRPRRLRGELQDLRLLQPRHQRRAHLRPSLRQRHRHQQHHRDRDRGLGRQPQHPHRCRRARPGHGQRERRRHRGRRRQGHVLQLRDLGEHQPRQSS